MHYLFHAYLCVFLLKAGLICGVARLQRGKRIAFLCDQCGHQEFTNIGAGDG